MVSFHLPNMSEFTTEKHGQPCRDYFGSYRHHGDYFKPADSVCSECLCNNGVSTKCFSIECVKPTCQDYKRVPGKCCDYVCPRFQLADATTLAILIILSIALLFIIIAIIIVWRKMRRKRLFGSRLDSISTSSNQDADMDAMIEQNSIPNNLRHQFTMINNHSSKTASNTLLLPKIQPHKQKHENNCSSTTVVVATKKCKQTNNLDKLNVQSREYSKVATCDLNQLSSSPSDEITNDSLTPETNQMLMSTMQNESCCHGNSCCHRVKTFEPPPPYTTRNTAATSSSSV